MSDKSSDENLSFEEKIVLYLLGGASLLVWAVTLLFVAIERGTASMAFALPIPTAGTWKPFTATPAASLTPTPTGTPTYPATYTPTSIPTSTVTPIPTPMPSGVAMLPLDGDIEVIALLGIDEDDESAVWRTDSIILTFVDRKAERLSLFSVPRDLWVRIPGYASNRINTVDALGERTDYPGGGLALLDKTLRFNLGIPVHHSIRLDFGGFVRIVDALGGVTVHVERSLAGFFPDPRSASGWKWITVPAGTHHMDGRMALTYCRSRMSTNDFDRSARQQQVLFAIWNRALDLETLTRAPQLWTEFNSAFSTDLTMTEAIQLAYFVQKLDPEQVRAAHVEYALVREWTTPEGAQVLLPQTEGIRQAVLDLVAPAE